MRAAVRRQCAWVSRCAKCLAALGRLPSLATTIGTCRVTLRAPKPTPPRRRSVRRVVAHALLSWSALIGLSVAVALAQSPQSDEVKKAIDELGSKLRTLAGDSVKLNEAMRTLDATTAPLRNRTDPQYIDQIIADLTAWIAGLPDAQKPAARTKLRVLIDATDALRDATDAERASRLIVALVRTMKEGRFNKADLDAIAQVPQLKEVGPTLAVVLKTKLTVNIIAATYGDHSTRRVCDARAYFFGRCEGHAKCPDEANAVIDGQTMCGYEPAPMAAPGKNAARVTYQCVDFAGRQPGDITCNDRSCMKTVDLRGKGQILCSLD